MLEVEAREEIRRVLGPFAEYIEAVSVFGSRATGRAQVNSDIDLVLHGDLAQYQLDRIYTLLDDSDLAVTVDVVAYAPDMPALLKHHIDTWAIPLLTREDLLHRANTAV